MLRSGTIPLRDMPRTPRLVSGLPIVEGDEVGCCQHSSSKKFGLEGREVRSDRVGDV